MTIEYKDVIRVETTQALMSATLRNQMIGYASDTVKLNYKTSGGVLKGINLDLVTSMTDDFVPKYDATNSKFVDSIISGDGSTITISGDLDVTGDITGTLPGHASVHETGGGDLVDHDNLTNFVANEHINHTSVSISAGEGIDGGGDISANRTISLKNYASLTDGYLLKWDDTNTQLANSVIYETGGKIGINEATPIYDLEVYNATGASVAATNGTSIVRMLGSSNGYIGTATNHRLDFIINNSAKMTLNLGGQLGIGTTVPSYQLQLSTDSAAKPSTNTWTVASDKKIKKNIKDFNKYGLKDILKLRPVEFDYNGKAGFVKQKEKSVGYIAQEVVEIMPEMVTSFKAKLNKNDKKETELLNVNTHLINFALIESIRELKKEIDLLKSKIKKQK